MPNRYVRGLAAAIVRNDELCAAARLMTARRYYGGVADGLRMSLAAWFAMNAAPGTAEDMIGEQVRVAVTLAQERAQVDRYQPVT